MANNTALRERNVGHSHQRFVDRRLACRRSRARELCGEHGKRFAPTKRQSDPAASEIAAIDGPSPGCGSWSLVARLDGDALAVGERYTAPTGVP
jgi:hypothetical protein